MNENKQLGDWGESFVDSYLMGAGWVLLEKNYRWRGGEIDRIALEQETLVFIEVKTRSDSRAFSDFPAFRHQQQKRLVLSARRYLYTKGVDWEESLGIQEYRFDCLYVGVDKLLEHVRDLHLSGLMRRF